MCIYASPVHLGLPIFTHKPQKFLILFRPRVDFDPSTQRNTEVLLIYIYIYIYITVYIQSISKVLG